MPKQLSDMKIDEISLVYKGANQHARVTIAKSADEGKEDMEEYFDEEGNLVDVSALELGDVVYDGDGQAYELNDEDEGSSYEDEDEGSYELVGKASTGLKHFPGGISRKARFAQGAKNFGRNAKRAGKRIGDWAVDNPTKANLATFGGTLGVGGALQYAADRSERVPNAFKTVLPTKEGNGRKLAPWAKEHVRKSLADDYREELSKALTDEERDDVFAKAFGDMEALAEQAYRAEEIAKAEHEARVFSEYVEVAKGYNLPVDDEELAGVMMRCAEALPEEDVEVIAKCFTVASNAMFEEMGNIGGGSNSDILAQVEAASVSKSGELDYDTTVAHFDSNPDLYEAYLEETGPYRS